MLVFEIMLIKNQCALRNFRYFKTILARSLKFIAGRRIQLNTVKSIKKTFAPMDFFEEEQTLKKNTL